MATLTIEEVKAQLGDIIHRLTPGEEVVITENNQPVAKLVASEAPRSAWPSEPGTAKPRRKLGQQAGSVLYMASDFDEPLEDFKEYME